MQRQHARANIPDFNQLLRQWVANKHEHGPRQALALALGQLPKRYHAKFKLKVARWRAPVSPELARSVCRRVQFLDTHLNESITGTIPPSLYIEIQAWHQKEVQRIQDLATKIAEEQWLNAAHAPSSSAEPD